MNSKPSLAWFAAWWVTLAGVACGDRSPSGPFDDGAAGTTASGGAGAAGSTGGGTAGASGPDGALDATTSVSFARDVLPVYVAKCGPCHGVSSAEAYAWFQQPATGSCAGRGRRIDVLPSKITTPVCGAKMPERATLTPAELNTLTSWVQASAPDN